MAADSVLGRKDGQQLFVQRAQVGGGLDEGLDKRASF
jgi:hypothetical protein